MSSPTNKTTTRNASKYFPTLRDPVGGWKNLAAVFYALCADILGVVWMIEYAKSDGTLLAVFKLAASILLAAHGRIVASYLVHEAAHASVFVEPSRANETFGIICLWLAGCPYVNFQHVRKLHIYHHKDRADVVSDFDYRQFVNSNSAVRNLVFALEWANIPAVETIMHVRAALYPIFCGNDTAYKCTASRRQSARIGTLVQIGFYLFLWHNSVVLPHFIAGALTLQFLSLHDAFQHTYQVIPLTDSYTPGPNGRTATYEEENTFSNLICVRPAWLNLISLNFGYHNAHHQKPMVPWYALPDWHNQLYGSVEMPQLLPFCELWRTWCTHKFTRIVDEDYGVVHPPGTPGRANDFVGALGVSFLTV
jgi:fatty acid desaturase